MAKSEPDRRAALTAEITAVLIRYRRRISDRGGVVPDACLDELVAVAERHGGGSPGPAVAGQPGPRPKAPRKRADEHPAEVPA
jgi:hypothetical protein